MHGCMLPVTSIRKTMSATPRTFVSWLMAAPGGFDLASSVSVKVYQGIDLEDASRSLPLWR